MLGRMRDEQLEISSRSNLQCAIWINSNAGSSKRRTHLWLIQRFLASFGTSSLLVRMRTTSLSTPEERHPPRLLCSFLAMVRQISPQQKRSRPRTRKRRVWRTQLLKGSSRSYGLNMISLKSNNSRWKQVIKRKNKSTNVFQRRWTLNAAKSASKKISSLSSPKRNPVQSSNWYMCSCSLLSLYLSEHSLPSLRQRW